MKNNSKVRNIDLLGIKSKREKINGDGERRSERERECQIEQGNIEER